MLQTTRTRAAKALLGEGRAFRWSEAFRIRRGRVAEALGSDRYSWPALNDIDRKLREYLPRNPGIFLEIGANDGYAQSNTYNLERLHGWRGILIEPVPSLFRVCEKVRPKSACFNVACVAEKTTQMVDIVDHTLESVTLGQQDTLEETARLSGRRPGPRLSVPAETLSEIIERSPFQSFTFMSIDVEGSELSVLGGLDLARFAPLWLLVETKHPDEVEARLSAMDGP